MYCIKESDVIIISRIIFTKAFKHLLIGAKQYLFVVNILDALICSIFHTRKEAFGIGSRVTKLRVNIHST